jgi:3-oxoacyl-[acyl-carrier-protein] synthase II
MGAKGRRRVVITGLGAVTPLASDVATSWEHLVSGRSAAGPITAFDPREFMVKFACEAGDFDPTRWIEHRRARRMGRFAQLVVAAARQAEADAGLEVEKESDRVGASVATAMGLSFAAFGSAAVARLPRERFATGGAISNCLR